MITESFPPLLPEPIRELYPFRTRTMHLAVSTTEPAGAPVAMPERMSFVDEGLDSAPPLVLVHGNLTWSFLFRKLIAEAREQHRVIALTWSALDCPASRVRRLTIRLSGTRRTLHSSSPNLT